MNFVYAFRVETSRRSLRLGTILVTRPVDGSFVSSTFSDQLFSGQDPHPKKLVLQLFLCQELPLARTLVFDYFRSLLLLQLTSAHFSSLLLTSAYFSLLQLTLAYFGLLQLTLAYFSLPYVISACFSLLEQNVVVAGSAPKRPAGCSEQLLDDTSELHGGDSALTSDFANDAADAPHVSSHRHAMSRDTRRPNSASARCMTS